MTRAGALETPNAAGALDTLRQTSLPVRAILLGTLVNRMGAFLKVFLVLYLLTLGYSAGQAGLALGLLGAGGIAGGIVGGWLADRLGARFTMLLANGAAGSFTIGILYAPNYVTLLAAVLLVGLCSDAFRPAAAATLAEHTPRARYTMIFAAQRLATNIGATAGPLIGALIVKTSYAAMFWIEGGVTIAVALLTSAALPAGRTSEHRDDSAADIPPAVTKDMGEGARAEAPRGFDRRFLIFLVGVLLTSLVYVQYLSALPLQVTHAGHTTAVFALLVAINGAVVTLFEMPATRVTQHWRARPTLVANVVLVGLGMCLYGLLHLGVAGLVIATVVWSLGEIIGAPTMFSYPAKIAPAGRQGLYLGAATAVIGAAFAGGPLLGTLGWAAFGTAVWPLSALVSVAAAAAIYFGTVPDRSGGHYRRPARRREHTGPIRHGRVAAFHPDRHRGSRRDLPRNRKETR